MFAVNDLVLFPGASLAYVAHGLTVQFEATLLQLMRVRGEDAVNAAGGHINPDSSRTNFTAGLHVGYFVLPELSGAVELRHQRWLSTPAAVEADTTDTLRDTTTVAVGPRLHFKVGEKTWIRPALAFAVRSRRSAAALGVEERAARHSRDFLSGDEPPARTERSGHPAMNTTSDKLDRRRFMQGAVGLGAAATLGACKSDSTTPRARRRPRRRRRPGVRRQQQRAGDARPALRHDRPHRLLADRDRAREGSLQEVRHQLHGHQGRELGSDPRLALQRRHSGDAHADRHADRLHHGPARRAEEADDHPLDAQSQRSGHHDARQNSRARSAPIPRRSSRSSMRPRRPARR